MQAFLKTGKTTSFQENPTDGQSDGKTHERKKPPQPWVEKQ